MDFQIDFGKFNVGPRAPGPLFAATSGIVLPLGPEECIYRLRADGSQHVMTHQVFEALHLCRAFRSLDEHAAVVVQGVHGLGGRADAVRRVLDNLVERRLLQSGEDYLAALKQDAPANPAALRAVFIRACDRPASLRVLIGDLLANETAHRAAHRYVVLDESRDPAHVRANAETLTRFAKDAGVRVEHLDATRWRASVERLERLVPGARDSLRYLLARDSAGTPGSGDGAARNLAALLAAGARFAMIDDETRLPLRRAPDALDGLDLAAAAAMPVRFYDHSADALADGAEVAGDAFGAQLRWCGQTLGHVLTQEPGMFPDRAALDGLEPAGLPHLAAGSRIVATCNGLRGDASGSGRDWLFLLEGESSAQFWSDRERYLRQLDGASVCFGPRRARVLDQGQYAPFLLDASRMLPPTLPTGARTDLLSGMLTRALWPNSVVLHTGLTLGHQGGSMPPRSGAQAWQSDTPGLASLLTDLLSSRLDEIRAESPARRLRGVANAIGDLAAAPAAKRADLLSEYLAFARADLIARLQAAFLAADNPPVYWQADARELIAVNGRALTAAGPPCLDGWPATLDTAQCSDRFARDLDTFATALDAWPALWEQAAGQGARLLDP